jgi:hypothetical protein
MEDFIMKKRFLSILAMGVVAAVLLTGCGNKCSESGCDGDVFEDGKCVVHALVDGFGSLFN